MNFLESNKKYWLSLIAAALVVLLVMVISQPGQINYRQSVDVAAQKQKIEQDEAYYAKVLADAEVNLQAGKEKIKEIVNDEVVRTNIEDMLGFNQKPAMPVITDSEIKISSRTDKDAIVQYLTKVESIAANYQSSISKFQENLFNPDSAMLASDAERAVEITKNTARDLRSMEVASPIIAAHKNFIIGYDVYDKILAAGQTYSQNPQDEQVWKDFYGTYKIMIQAADNAQSEIDKISKIYALSESDFAEPASGMFVKKAQALSIFGFEFTIDIWQKAWTAFKTGIAKAFIQFFTQSAQKLINYVSKNFTIVSQLYYANELDRNYVNEFLEKYAKTAIDKAITKQFLPDLFCEPKDPELLRQIFVAKVKQASLPYLNLDVSDPDWLPDTITYLTTPEHRVEVWEGGYEAVASVARFQSSSASAKEVLSEGYKVGRGKSANDFVNSKIEKAVLDITNVQKSSIDGIVNGGIYNGDNIVAKLIAKQTEAIVSNFLFTSAGGGNIEVFKESEKCLKIPVINPIAPVPGGTQPIFPDEPSDGPYPTYTFNPQPT